MASQQPPRDDESDPRAPGLRRIEREVEKAIRGAAEAGELSGLEGEGRPLRGDAAAEQDERWSAMRVARNAGLVPEWSDLRREIDAERDRLERRVRAHLEWLEARREGLADLPAERILDAARVTRERDEEFRRELEQALGALNRVVARHNSVAPVMDLQLPPLRVERLFQRARRRG